MKKDETVIIQAINDLIFHAILHGADAGGSYEQNEEGLQKSVLGVLELLGVKGKYVLLKTYRDGWNVSQLFNADEINGLKRR